MACMVASHNELLCLFLCDVDHQRVWFTPKKGEINAFCLQGVHAMLTCMPDRVWRPEEKRYCKMVFIGRDLDKDLIRNGFQECLAT